MRWSKFTSASRGTLSRTSVLSVSRLAIINGKVAFLAPEIGIVPLSLWPPWMRMRSMPPPPNSGGIVGLGGGRHVGAAGAGFRLDLASLEILPQRGPQAPLLPHLLRALSPLVHGRKITTRGRATEALRREWPLEGACLRHVGPYGKDRSARGPISHWSIFASRPALP